MPRRRRVSVVWKQMLMEADTTLQVVSPALVGVYVIGHALSGRKIHPYPKGHSHLLYSGEGDLVARLNAHLNNHESGNTEVYNHASRRGAKLEVHYAYLDKAAAQCCEAELFDAFEARYGRLPIANGVRGTCSLDAVSLVHDIDVIAHLHYAGPVE